MVAFTFYCLMGPWSTILLLKKTVDPIGKEAYISGSVMVLIIFVCPLDLCFIMFIIIIQPIGGLLIIGMIPLIG